MMIAAVFVVAPAANAVAGPGTVDFEFATSDAPEEDTPHTLNVVLDVGGPGDTLDVGFTVEVVVAASPGTAIGGGTDYTYTSLPIRFDAGAFDGAVAAINSPIGIVNDPLDEADETIELELVNLTNDPLGTSSIGSVQRTHRVNIIDNDTATLAVSDESVGEGGTMTFDVTLSTPSASSVDVSYSTADVDATAGSDYTAVPLTPVTFAPGETLKTVPVTTLQDFIYEGTGETFTLDLSSPIGAGIFDGSGVGTITDDDSAAVVVTPTTVAVAEGGATATYDVALTSSPSANVYVTVSGDPDVTALPTLLTFTPTAYGAQTVTVTAVNDAFVEGAHTGTLTHLIRGDSASEYLPEPVSPVTATITDNNFTVEFDVASTSVPEGDVGSTPGAIELELDTNGVAAATGPAVPAGATVDVVQTGGTATSGPDFTFTSPLTVPIGELADGAKVLVPLAVVGDVVNEANETVILGLANVSAGGRIEPGADAHTLTILDDDGPPGLSVIDATPVTEGAGEVVLKFTVAMLPAAGQEITVDYATADGTAIAGSDYTAIPTTPLTFDVIPGTGLTETTKDVFVTVLNDAIDEIDETVLLNLSGSPIAPIADAQGVGTIMDDDNQPPTIDKFLITDAAGIPKTTFTLGETTKVNVEFSDPGVADTHEVVVSWQDGTDDFYQVIRGAGSETRTVVATHAYEVAARHTITVIITDEEGAFERQDAIPILVEGSSDLDTVGLVDPATGVWRLRDAIGNVSTFYYGNPGDFPFVGDWDCNGTETPGLYRQSDGFVYLRNSNTQGIADIRFFFGNPGDIPLAGDFNGDGCDTVSIYRPSEGRVFIINKLGANDGGLGAAELSYYFGNPGDKPFVGDFNRNGIETVGLHRETTGLVYFRNSHTQGIADNQFYFGDPGDRLVAGDWTRDAMDTPGLFRPSNTTIYFRHSNTQGNADDQYMWGEPSWLPVAGYLGL
jgi:hypothetical protein